MMIRQKAYRVGDLVRVRNVLSYPLPAGLADGMRVRVVAISPGARVVAREGARWEVAMVNIESGYERLEDSAGAFIERIVSGGQTGADRAALDWAIQHRIAHGGWCPMGRKAEDGRLPARYRLRETPSDSYIERTEWNVRDSDGTVIISISPVLCGGSRSTAEFCDAYRRPWIHLSAARERDHAPRRLREFVALHRIRLLNVAGPRASAEPDVAGFVTWVLEEASRAGSSG
jgi:hypothetical protein